MRQNEFLLCLYKRSVFLTLVAFLHLLLFVYLSPHPPLQLTLQLDLIIFSNNWMCPLHWLLMLEIHCSVGEACTGSWADSAVVIHSSHGRLVAGAVWNIYSCELPFGRKFWNFNFSSCFGRKTNVAKVGNFCGDKFWISLSSRGAPPSASVAINARYHIGGTMLLKGRTFKWDIKAKLWV